MSITREALVGIWKKHEREFIFSIILTVVAFLSFGLGYLSATDSERAPLIIEKRSEK